MQAAIRPGIEEAARKWEVQLPEGWSDEFDMDYNRFGNQPITGGRDMYIGIARQIWNCHLELGRFTN